MAAPARAARPVPPDAPADPPASRVRIPGRSLLTWLTVFGMSRPLLKLAARRGDLLSRLVIDPELHDDPFDAYDQVRAGGPLVNGRVISATASHAAANQVLRGEAFGVADGHGELGPRMRRLVEVVSEPGALGPLAPPSMLAVDPPTHTRYRRRVSRVFTPRAVAALEPKVRAVADGLLDRIAAGPGEFDVIAEYAARLPIAVITEILGVPADMHDQVLQWGDGAVAMLDPGLSWRQYRAAERDTRELRAWFDDHIARLRRDPGDDLLSQLSSLDGADRLSELELSATGLLVLGAGFETTVNLIGNAVAQLDLRLDQLAEAKADPGLWPNVVEEVLRFDSPVQFTLRQSYTGTEVGGVPIPAGRGVLVMLGGANRDPEVFEDPHRFDIHRANAAEHLAFSSGVHYCLGAGLARMEAAVALRALYERFPELSIAEPPVRRETRILRGYRRIKVTG